MHPSLLFCLRPSAFLHPTHQSTPTPLSSTNVHLPSLRGSRHSRIPLLFPFLLATVSDGHPRNCLLRFRKHVSTWVLSLRVPHCLSVGHSKKKITAAFASLSREVKGKRDSAFFRCNHLPNLSATSAVHSTFPGDRVHGCDVVSWCCCFCFWRGLVCWVRQNL